MELVIIDDSNLHLYTYTEGCFTTTGFEGVATRTCFSGSSTSSSTTLSSITSSSPGDETELFSEQVPEEGLYYITVQ